MEEVVVARLVVAKKRVKALERCCRLLYDKANVPFADRVCAVPKLVGQEAGERSEVGNMLILSVAVKASIERVASGHYCRGGLR